MSPLGQGHASPGTCVLGQLKALLGLHHDSTPPSPPAYFSHSPGPWPHLLLEEALAVAQAAQLALLLLVLQLFRGRLKVADEVLQAQDDALEG